MKVLRSFIIILIFIAGTGSLAAQGGQMPAPVNSDSLFCQEKLSKFQELIQKGKFKDAQLMWNTLYSRCHGYSEELYTSGILLYDQLWNQEKDSATKVMLVDSLMLMFDRQILYFGKEGSTLGRKGTELFNHNPAKAKEAFNIIHRSVELEAVNTKPNVLLNYLKAAIFLASKGLMDTATVIATYDDCRVLIMMKMQSKAMDKDLIISVSKNIDLSFNSFLGCDQLQKVYQPQLRTDSIDYGLMEQIIQVLEKNHCITSDFYLSLTKRLYDRDTLPENAIRVARYFVKKYNHSLSIPLLLRAFKCKDSLLAAEAHLEIARIYMNTNRYILSRDNALEALALNPKQGEPLIIIGDCYVLGISECGESDFGRRTVYWAAVDKYEEAKKKYPDLRTLAESRIAKFSKQFPEEQAMKKYRLEEGSNYTVGCWINEKTTARALKKAP